MHMQTHFCPSSGSALCSDDKNHLETIRKCDTFGEVFGGFVSGQHFHHITGSTERFSD